MPGVAFQSLRTSGSAQPLSPAPSAVIAADSLLIPAPAAAAASIAGVAAVVQIPAPSAVNCKAGTSGTSWSKDLLAPAAAAGGKDWQSPGTLKVGCCACALLLCAEKQ
jgi:hypothetical protein